MWKICFSLLCLKELCCVAVLNLFRRHNPAFLIDNRFYMLLFPIEKSNHYAIDIIKYNITILFRSKVVPAMSHDRRNGSYPNERTPPLHPRSYHKESFKRLLKY